MGRMRSVLCKRISIVGTSGSGKSTLAVMLSRALSLPHYELDAINWLPDWKQRDPEEFKKIVSEKVKGDSWIMEGNYGRIREVVWHRATTVIWLNMPFYLVFYRMVIRIFKRVAFKEVLWSGNRETLAKHLFTKESMLYWVIKTHRRRKREYQALFRDERFKHLEKIELKGRRAVSEFIEVYSAEANVPGKMG